MFQKKVAFISLSHFTSPPYSGWFPHYPGCFKAKLFIACCFHFLFNQGNITSKSWYYICKPKWRFPTTQFCLTTNANSCKWKAMERNTNKYLKIGSEKRKKRIACINCVSIMFTVHVKKENDSERPLATLFSCFLYPVFYVPIINIGKWHFRKTSGLDDFTGELF